MSGGQGLSRNHSSSPDVRSSGSEIPPERDASDPRAPNRRSQASQRRSFSNGACYASARVLNGLARIVGLHQLRGSG